jgi:hypothetical protein
MTNEYVLTVRDWKDSNGALLINVKIDDATLDRVREVLCPEASP